MVVVEHLVKILILIVSIMSCDILKNHEEPYILKVAFPQFGDISDYDTANVTKAYQYTVLENLYANLVTINENGDLVGVLAEDFGWTDERTAFFKIKSGLKSSKGGSITIEDVYKSILRILVLNSTHGQLSDYLATPDFKLTSIREVHPDISIKDSKIFFKLSYKNYSFFNLLTSVDYAIIPSSSIDNETLKIKDYTNTTGPYFYKGKIKSSNTFQRNSNFVNYRSESANEILFIESVVPKNSIELIKLGKVDVITTDDTTSPSDLITFAENNNNYTLHRTRDLMLNFLFFTSSGLDKVKLEERMYIFLKLKEIYNEYIKNFSYISTTDQFFSNFAEGAIEKNELEKKMSEFRLKSKVPEYRIRIGVYPRDLNYYQSIFANVPFLDLVPKGATFTKSDNDLDGFIGVTDVGYHEDSSLISYSIKAGLLGHNPQNASKILKQLTNLEKKKDRIEFIKKIHYDSFKDVKFIPFSRTSYVAVATKQFVIKLPKDYSNTHLWKIFRN